jgi:hypothetical protein
MNIDEIIEMFNDGNLDIPNYFNNIETFFKIIDKRGRLDELDLEGNYMENDYLLYLSETNTQKFREEVARQINDVSFEEGKEPVLQLRDLTDLGKLFCDGVRSDISQDTISGVLSGDFDWYPYSDTTDDVYQDVIEVLDEENQKYLYNYIVKNLEGVQIEPETELLGDIATQQNTDNAEITMENVQSVVRDEETMNYLMENGLDELRSELYSIHSNSYNMAYETMIYNEVWDKLDDIFDVENRKFVYKQHPYKKESKIEVLEIPIRDFYTPIKDYLNNSKGSSQTLEYFGDFINILEDNGDCLRFWASDYPNSSEIDKNINEIFGDYI